MKKLFVWLFHLLDETKEFHLALTRLKVRMANTKCHLFSIFFIKHIGYSPKTTDSQKKTFVKR